MKQVQTGLNFAQELEMMIQIDNSGNHNFYENIRQKPLLNVLRGKRINVTVWDLYLRDGKKR